MGPAGGGAVVLDDIELYLSTPGIKVCDIYGERPMSEHRMIRWLMNNCRDYIELTLASRKEGLRFEQANLHRMQQGNTHVQQ